MSVPGQLRPRPVYCVIEHEHRDLALAEAICGGRFSHLGLTLELGAEPDWLGVDLAEDEEWQIALSKFYYGLDLAFAFGETGDPRYLRSWERLLRSWIQRVPAGAGASDVAGRRIQNWIYAWNRFAAAPRFRGLADGLAEEILASLVEQVGHLRAHLTPERNHRTLELYALFIAALALPQLDHDGTLLGFAVDQLQRNLLGDVTPDGVQRERTTHYHMIALRSFLGARENARRAGIAFSCEYDRRLERACEFAMHIHRPDGLIPALSDSDTGSYAGLLELAAGLFDRPDLLYAATAGANGTPPRQRSAGFPGGGYFVQRSGWGETTRLQDEGYLIFDCGPLGDGGHGHYDLLNFECSAWGQPLIVDPGRYTYSEHGPNWRRWFKGTAAHNTVCVDGLDQTPYHRGKPKAAVAQGRLLARRSAPGFDVLCGEASSPSYDAVHTRWILFVAGEYWIVVDCLSGKTSHRYDLRFHLAPAAWQRTTTVTGERQAVARAPGLALVFTPPREPCLEAGWFAPYYGQKLPAPVVSVVAGDAPDATFVTLIVPCRSGDAVPQLAVRSDLTTAAQAMVLEVRGVGDDQSTRDLVAWSRDVDHYDLGSIRCRASAAWLRETGHGEPTAFRACDAGEVAWAPSGHVARPPIAVSGGWAMWDAGSPPGGIIWGAEVDQ